MDEQKFKLGVALTVYGAVTGMALKYLGDKIYRVSYNNGYENRCDDIHEDDLTLGGYIQPTRTYKVDKEDEKGCTSGACAI